MSWLFKQLDAGGVNVQKIDSATGSSFGSSRYTAHPFDYGTGGHYQWAKRTGTMAAALAAGANLFSFRWGSTTFKCLPLYLRVTVQTLTVWTAHQEFSLEAYYARSFSASHTGGTAGTLTGNMGKAATSMSTSQIPTNGDIRISSTAALGGGTLTIDTDPFALGIGCPNEINAAAGTAYSLNERPFLHWEARAADARHPLLFAQNDGLVVRNAIVWPAAGTAVLGVEFGWCELPLTMFA